MNSKLLVIPSIDIKNGKTVRVVQGIPELDVPEYGNDPVEAAIMWRAENAKCLHIVDHDPVWDQSRRDTKLIEKICTSVIIPVQLGGGIRTLEDAKRILDAGVYRIVVGSVAYENPVEFRKIVEHIGPKRIAAAIDVYENEVVVMGRKTRTGLSPREQALMFRDYSLERLIITDVKNNGMMTGPNIDLSKDLSELTKIKVTLSGGVKNKDDLMNIQQYMNSGIDSVIVGRALYENNFPCQRLWRVAESGIFN